VVGDTYRIEKELGGGGMSRVFLAEEVALGRQVVIKVLPPEMAADVSQERFHREIKLAAKLQHPHVVPLLTAGADGDLLYYVMPFIKGESLRVKLAREGELPVGEALRILREVTDALAYAHRSGVVHRDIKPDNVLLSEGHAVVTDFGVAKAVSASSGSSSSLTSLGIALGTPAYMAPEQAAADPHTDHRADIYAVGALAYEMLCGRPPFTGATPQAVMAAHVTEAPEPMTKHRSTVSEGLNALVLRCLEKKAADRWQSAAELVPQFDALLTPTAGMTPAGTAPVSAVSLETAVRQTHPGRVAGLFALGALGALAIVYLLMLQLGLPTWVFYGAIVLLVAGFPMMLLTGRHERKRAVARATGVMTATPATGVQRHFTWSKAALGGGIAFGALALVAAVYMAMRVLGIGPVGTLVASGVLGERERLVLARFENSSPDTTLAETVTELFHIDLTQSPTVSVMEASQVAIVLRRMERDPGERVTLELATEIAEREGIKAVLAGEIRPLGSGYVLSARLVAVGTGDVLWAGRENAASADQVIDAVDRLSASLREKVGESLRTIRGDPPLERVTTRSTVALRRLLEGGRANDVGDVGRAISLLEEAVAEDSGFAMAWRKLGVVLHNTGRDRERRDSALSQAMRLGDRLTERERYLTEGTYYQLVEDDDQAAIAAYRSVLDKYPDDRIALNNLANLYGGLGREEEALELRLHSVALGHAPAVTYQGTISSLYRLGAADSARQVLEMYAEEYPDQPVMLRFRAALASATGEYDSAQATLEYLRSSQRGSPQWEMLAAFELSNVAAVRGKIDEARRQVLAGRAKAEQLGLTWTREQPRDVWVGQIEAWVLLLFGNDPEAAVRKMDAALRALPSDSLDPEDRQYLGSAVFYARAGRPERAREFMAAYEAEVDAETREDEVEGWHNTRGEIALAEGAYSEAIAEFKLFREGATGCVMCGLFELAEAFDRAGQADSAQAYYERYLDAPQLFRGGNDNGNLWRTLRRLGELYEERGDTAQAVEYYNRFVDLWNDADPELQPIVRDVRERLARLVGEG